MMRKRTIRRLGWALVVIALVLLVGGQVFGAQKKFGLDDIPPIKNKQPINVAYEAGTGAEILYPFVEKFAEKTGVKVTVEEMVFAVMYTKENVELVGRTGAYDVITVESSWTDEWGSRGFLVPLEDLAAKYDPEGAEGLKRYLANLDPSINYCDSHAGKVRGIPCHAYTFLMVYREDVFDDPIEKENFEKRYGYPLAPAEDWYQIRDQAEFFTRKKGEKLKGKVLEEDIYGMSMMAGRYPHVQDEVSAIMWSMGGRWAQVVRDEEGNLVGFKPTANNPVGVAAVETYKSLLPFAPPGTLGGFWDFAMAQFRSGRTIMWPTCYYDLWWVCAQVEDVVPGAKIGTAPTPGVHPYIGTFYLGASQDSKNQEAAYWFLKYIGSYEVQKVFGEKGWATVRRDVLEDPEYRKPEWHRYTGWMPAMVYTYDKNLAYVPTYLHFHSDAFGKIYEEMMIEAHEAASGRKTAKQAMDDWVKKFIELQETHGTIPVLK